MKKSQIALVALVLWLAVPALAQQQWEAATNSFWNYGVPQGRLLLPKHWVRGYAQFDGAPPTDEPDLDRCASLPLAQAATSQCTAYARYMISGYVELQPFGRTFLRHMFAFYEPRFSFGRNIPQVSYTASFEPMAYERSIGCGIELPKNFELRVVQHQVRWLGRYNQNLGANDLGPTGPYGLYATVGLRWYFGGYGRSHGGSGL